MYRPIVQENEGMNNQLKSINGTTKLDHVKMEQTLKKIWNTDLQD